MAAGRGVKNLTLYYLKKKTRFDNANAALLPEAYRKFYKEWKQTLPAPVHYIEEPGKYKRNERTGEVFPVQNIPIPLKYPKEHNEGIWGGEAIVKGFQKRHQTKRRVPHFWFPTLKRTVLYSEVLDKYMNIVITQRTMDLIHESYGFDHYLLKNRACDLKSELALKLKKKILQTLSDKSLYPDDSAKREEVYGRYKEYLSAYTPEEIEWYGLNWTEACKKIRLMTAQSVVITPLKHQYRAELIEKLKTAKEEGDEDKYDLSEPSVSWLSKINPLSKSKSS